MPCHLTENSILFIAKFDFHRINPPDAVLKLDNAVDLPNLASWMTAAQMACVHYIGPLFPNMKLTQLVTNLTEPGLPSNFTI